MVLGLTRLTIHEAFAFRTTDCICCTFSIGNAKLGTAIVPEIKFSKVAVKVGLTAMLIGAVHTALEH